MRQERHQRHPHGRVHVCTTAAPDTDTDSPSHSHCDARWSAVPFRHHAHSFQRSSPPTAICPRGESEGYPLLGAFCAPSPAAPAGGHRRSCPPSTAVPYTGPSLPSKSNSVDIYTDTYTHPTGCACPEANTTGTQDPTSYTHASPHSRLAVAYIFLSCDSHPSRTIPTALSRRSTEAYTSRTSPLNASPTSSPSTHTYTRPGRPSTHAHTPHAPP